MNEMGETCLHQDAVKWNPYNRVVQCHRCGEQFVPISAALSPRMTAQATINKWHLVLYGRSPRGHLGYIGMTVRAKSQARAARAGQLIAQRWGWTQLAQPYAVMASAYLATKAMYEALKLAPEPAPEPRP